MTPIEQAIEALEAVVAYDSNTSQDGADLMLQYAEFMEQSRAALSALRGVEQQPVGEKWTEQPSSRPLREYLEDRIATMTPEQLARYETARDRIKAAIATPPPAPVLLTEAEILEILGDVDADTKRLPPGVAAFARAIESEVLRRVGA